MSSMFVRMSATAVVVAVVVGGLSACGGSDESADSSADAMIAQVQEICDERASSLADRGGFPVDDFDPENPDAADLPAVGEYFAAGRAEQQQAIADLKAISATGEQREQLDALIDAWEAEYAGAQEQVDAALAGDVAGFVATLDDASVAIDAVAAATGALGVPDCGQG